MKAAAILWKHFGSGKTSNREVAALLSLAVGTAETLLASVHRRLWILSRCELAEARGEPTVTGAP